MVDLKIFLKKSIKETIKKNSQTKSYGMNIDLLMTW